MASPASAQRWTSCSADHLKRVPDRWCFERGAEEHFGFVKFETPVKRSLEVWNWRRGSESNRRMELLQSSALPLGYPAAYCGPKLNHEASRCKIRFSVTELRGPRAGFAAPHMPAGQHFCVRPDSISWTIPAMRRGGASARVNIPRPLSAATVSPSFPAIHRPCVPSSSASCPSSSSFAASRRTGSASCSTTSRSCRCRRRCACAGSR